MGIPKLPTVGGYKVDVTPKTSTSDTYDGTAAAKTKQDRGAEKAASHTDERDIDPRKTKKEHDEKILQDARKMDFDGQNAKDVKSIAEQNAKMLRDALNKQLQQKKSQ